MNSTIISYILAFAVLSTDSVVQTLSNRDTVLQFYEWKYSDIAEECDGWLSEKKFAAIQVKIKTVFFFAAGFF
jgi:hypothetical protein